MGWVINSLQAPDSYTPQSTLQSLPSVQRINLDVLNQPIFWQLQTRSGGGLYTQGQWGEEVFMAPGSRSLYRDGILGVRFRAAVPAAQLPPGTYQAVVTVEAIA